MTATLPATVAVPAAARRPRRDGRLLAGVVLVLGSVVLGARAVSSAAHTTPLLVAARDLPAGHVVADGDLTSRPAHLGHGIGGYLPGTGSVTGRTLTQALRSGELVPAAAVATGPTATAATVPVTLDAGHAPDLAPGDLVDVWSTFAIGADRGCVTVEVATGLEVTGTDDTISGAQAVSLHAPAELVGPLVHASAVTEVVLVRHGDGAPPQPQVDHLAGLAPTGSCAP